ncbi:uncharacterized protein N7484_007983 [Penicillium longicatenatum]|uniref:uncharacterized protein n=1 Tax=Penicillium longicatenatum TaxID=1561947 RepID=UPI00254699DF|nr:uncharacterized protein N7484_007983 [Penicillium longicatenatum]KAJ5640121.1 hypothetical protein N7484_007983 [Penicillium longicatenatum]
MKFSIATIAALASAVSASLPAAFTLVADGGKTVLTDGQNLWIGANTTTHEIAILRSSNTGDVTFTSKHETPTGFQSLYMIPNEGANMTAFGVNEKGYFTHGGKAYFAVDGYGSNPAKEIYWYGSHNAEYMAANLYVKECKGC